ncbi:hypothetical protein [Roseicyclus persicicus]|uniref:hypothetical protein n=1 Tax=Roseicyclus persicicus TaxID=2650661 RepID=UPI001EF10D13|nr:hypothetical protein [Roseibacterium persicicum]
MPRPLPVLFSLSVLSVALAGMSPATVTAEGIGLPDAAQLEAQMAEMERPVPGSIWALNPYRNAQTATAADGTTYTLTSLNPHVNAWFVLEVAPASGRSASYHLESGDPAAIALSLAAGDAPALVIDRDGDEMQCRPWEDGELEEARASDLPFAPVCDWSLFVRNPVRGNRTTREAVSQFLRDNVLFGDSIVNLIKGAFYEDAFMVSSEGFEAEEEVDGVALLGSALLSSTPQMRPSMGFDLEGTDGGAMTAGNWYAVEDAPGVYASVMQPGMIAREVFDVRGANGLDGVENRADVYLVAFDLTQFELGYEVGTDHPSLGWSSRPSGGGRHYQGPGPDGFDRPDPLVFNGMLSPNLYERVAATFTGGFKRDHGAWRFGDYATFNWGHHYGFLTHGVLFSRLWPNLATLYVLDDGTVGMRTWTEDDADMLDRMVFARQNGVPLIENGVPGDRVTSWGGGNWSGSAEADLRTLRAGACLRTVGDRPFLIYAYFSTATPSGMARTFQAYQCDYAMLLDMNSQELTYLAVYTRDDGDLETHHLVSGMAESDPRDNGGRIPRFVEAPDNRDFFYLVRRE